MRHEEDSRLEAFRQFRKEIRGSKEYLIVGIDIAKEKHHAFFGTATGKTLFKRLIFDNTIEGFRKLLDQTETIQATHKLKSVVFGMEPTANYHKPLGEHLIRCGKTLVLVGGLAVKRNRELLDGRWDKHDDKDAANVADLISQGKCLFYEYPAIEIRDLRNLLSLKRKLKKLEHGYRVRIRNQLIAQYFPELDSYSGYSETESIVRWCLDPSQIAGFEKDQFKDMVSTSGRQTLMKKKRLDDIQKLAIASIGCEVGQGASFDAKIMTVLNVGGYIVKALEEDYRPVSSLKQKLEKDNAASKAKETTEAEEKEKQIAANHYYKYKEDKVFEYVDCLDKEEVSALITDFGATFTLGQFERGQKWANGAEPGIKFEAIKESPALRTKFVNFVIEIFLADRILSFRDFSKNG